MNMDVSVCFEDGGVCVINKADIFKNILLDKDYCDWSSHIADKGKIITVVFLLVIPTNQIKESRNVLGY